MLKWSIFEGEQKHKCAAAPPLKKRAELF